MATATQKKRLELEGTPEDTHVVLVFTNGEKYEGKFKAMDDDSIMLESLSGKNMIGLPMKHLSHYFEIKE